MYFFNSHNIVGCLASIGDSDKMIHIPKEGTFVVLIVSIVPNDLYGRFFSSLIFFCNITGEKSLQ